MKEHYVVFGATEKPDKALIVTKSPETHIRAVTICQLKDGLGKDYGDSVEDGDINGYYTTLMFCKKESLDTFIKSLEVMREKWDEWNEAL